MGRTLDTRSSVLLRATYLGRADPSEIRGRLTDMSLVLVEGTQQPVAVPSSCIQPRDRHNTRLTEVDFHEDRSAFSKRLRRLRRAANLSQEKLAEAVGVRQSAVSQWEKGKTTPRLALIEVIAGVLGVTPGDLLDRQSS